MGITAATLAGVLQLVAGGVRAISSTAQPKGVPLLSAPPPAWKVGSVT